MAQTMENIAAICLAPKSLDDIQHLIVYKYSNEPATYP